jgi:hypothetical protein
MMGGQNHLSADSLFLMNMLSRPHLRKNQNLSRRTIPLTKHLCHKAICLQDYVFLTLKGGYFCLVPRLYIEGGPEIFAKGGSDVRLKCSVRGSLEDDWDIAWYVFLLLFAPNS